eukprot:gene12160-biopygen9433
MLTYDDTPSAHAAVLNTYAHREERLATGVTCMKDRYVVYAGGQDVCTRAGGGCRWKMNAGMTACMRMSGALDIPRMHEGNPWVRTSAAWMHAGGPWVRTRAGCKRGGGCGHAAPRRAPTPKTHTRRPPQPPALQPCLRPPAAATAPFANHAACCAAQAQSVWRHSANHAACCAAQAQSVWRHSANHAACCAAQAQSGWRHSANHAACCAAQAQRVWPHSANGQAQGRKRGAFRGMVRAGKRATSRPRRAGGARCCMPPFSGVRRKARRRAPRLTRPGGAPEARIFWGKATPSETRNHAPKGDNIPRGSGPVRNRRRPCDLLG